MKKLLLTPLRKNLTSLFVFVVFLATFVQLSVTPNAVVLTGLSTEYMRDGDTLLNTPTRNWNKYDWYYGLYETSEGDTVVVAPGDTLILKEGVTCKSMTKCLDSWMWREFYVGYGDWVVFSEPILPKREVKLVLKLSDYRKSQRIQLAAVPVFLRKNQYNIKGNSYFDNMRFVSEKSDHVIRSKIAGTKDSFLPVDVLFKKREGKPKLRPLLAYSSQQLFKNKTLYDRLYAASEANTLALYAANWIIDDKSEFPAADLTIASAIFNDIAHQCLEGNWPNRVAILEKYQKTNRISYDGQIIDIKILTLANAGVFTEASFMEHYLKRCSQLNAPYGFSAWSGAMVGDASSDEADLLYDIGINLGTGLQMVNDLKELSPLLIQKHDQKQGRLTLPLWMHHFGVPTLDIVKRVKKETAQCFNDSMAIVEQLPNTEEKTTFERILQVLIHNKVFSSFA